MTTQNISDEEIQAHLADESTPAPLRAAYEVLRGQLEAERAKNVATERRAAFAEAGLPDSPVRALFEKTYEGEMTAEAIKAAAEPYGLTGTPAAPAQTPPAEDRSGLEALRRVAAASNGAPAGAPMDFGDALDRAQSPEHWDAIMANAPPEAGIVLPRSVRGSRII